MSARPIAVGDVMHRPVVTVPLTMAVGEAIASLREQHVRHAVVVDGARIAGVVSEHDLAAAHARLTTRWLVHDVMSAQPVTVAPETSIAEAAQILRTRRIGCLPVVRGGALVGIVTRGDLLALLETHGVASAPPVRCRWPVHGRRPRTPA